jgi:hypothetical protein
MEGIATNVITRDMIKLRIIITSGGQAEIICRMLNSKKIYLGINR